MENDMRAVQVLFFDENSTSRSRFPGRIRHFLSSGSFDATMLLLNSNFLVCTRRRVRRQAKAVA